LSTTADRPNWSPSPLTNATFASRNAMSVIW